MTADKPFYTMTMAGVHARQGNLAEAERVYRYLLTREPERPDLIAAMADIKARRANRKIEDLLPLFRQWLDLAFRYNRLKKLKKLNDLYERKGHV